MRKIFKELMSDGTGYPLIGMYLATYVLLQYSGLFGPRPGSVMRVLHHAPSLAGVAALMAYGIAWGYRNRSGPEAPGRRRASSTLARLAYVGMMLCGAGIMLSSLTRFEGSLALTEGQEVSLAAESFDVGTLYRRRFSRVPQGTLVAGQIKQVLFSSGKYEGTSGAIVLYRKAGGDPRILRINSLFPVVHDGNTLAVDAVGYAPHVFLFDRGGATIDNFYAVLQLLPAGTEDMFRFEGSIPHTFYMGYYPDVSLVPDVAQRSPVKAGPLYKVRIARNLDIVANQYAAPGETVFFDKLIFSAGDIRKWVEVRIVRDPGMYLMWPGIALLLCYPIAIVVRRYTRKADT
jgi:hypothetical protein